MGWFLGLLLVLTALLVGLLVGLFLILRQERLARPPGDGTGGSVREKPVAAARQAGSAPALRQRWAAVPGVVWGWLAKLVAALRRLRPGPAQSQPQPAQQPEPEEAERWEVSSWQQRHGRPAMQRMIGPAAQREELSQETPAHRVNQPVFSRTVLLFLVVVVIAALAISLWRVGLGFVVSSNPPPQLTILIATLPGSGEGQSNAELLAQIQQDFAAAGLPPTLTLQVITEQPVDADSAYALARAHQSDLLLWGHVRPDVVPGYFLTLTLTPRLVSRLAPEFPEYGSMMMTPVHFSLNRVETRGVSKVEVARALTWVAHFYAGQFDRLESVPSAELQGNVPAALFQFHWMALRWLKGDYEGAKTAYANLGCPVEFVEATRPLSPRQQADLQLCLAAANDRAVVLITQESLGLVPASSLDGAATSLASIVKVAPETPTAWYNLGRAYLARGRWSEAVVALVKAVQQSPLQAAAWAALSEASTEAGDLPRAHEAATQSMRLDNSMVTAYLAQGRYLMAVGQLQEAEQVLGQALQRAEAETTRRRSLEAALREGPRANPPRAEFTAAWARRNDTMLARVHLARARVFLRQGEIEGQTPILLWIWRLIVGELSPLEKADAEIQLALETHPEWATVLRARAQLLIARGSLEDAVVLLRKLQEQDPSDLGIYLDLIKVLQRQWREHRAAGRTTEAEQKLAELRAQYQLLIDRQIAPALGYFGLGDAAQENGEWDTARQAYLQAVAADSSYAEAYLRLGQVELQTPDEAKALAYLDQALETSGKKGAVAVSAYCERGEILLEQYLRLKAQGEKGPLAESQQAFEAARELDGRATRALNGLGRIAYEEGNVAGAEGFYQQAQAIVPGNFDTLYGLGRVYEARGQSRVARDYFFQAVVARSTSIAAHYHLGVAYYATLDAVLARRNLEWVQTACANLSQQKRPKADDTESCAGVEDWLKRIPGGK